MAALELQFFGPPRVRRDGEAVRFDTRKAVAMLAVLAVDGREYSRAAIASMLWPELDRNRARAALRRTLSVAAAVGPALEVSAAGVRLDLDRTDCDVRDFQALAGSDRVGDWARAAAVAADGFLEGFALRDSPAFEDWQMATADSLRDQLSQVLGRLVSDAAERGRFPEALGYARRRTQVDPLSEPAHADLIRVAAWSGDRSGALQAYRALVRLLDRELGVPPLPETLALHEAIRTDALPLPAPRVRATERLVVPVVQPVRLVGRERESGQLATIWLSAADGGRGAGLVGDPGIGKTALASELAAHAAASGAPVLWVTGHATEQPLAYASANDLVRSMLALSPGLVADLGTAGEPLGALAAEVSRDDGRAIRNPGDLRRVYEAVRAALEALAADAQLLLVVDDAHHLDVPSATLLAYVLRRMPRGLVVLVIWSTGDGGAPLPAAVAETGPVIAVSALDSADIAELLDGSGIEPVEVLRRTGGIPLLVREFAMAGEPVITDDLASARDMVAARFEAASAIARQLVGAAAIIGTVADPELLRVACGRDEVETVDAIEEAIARGLLVEHADGPGYDVPHDLVRDAALGRLSLARTRLLHGRVADVLVRRHGVDPSATPAGSVARHLAEAGRDEQAGEWFLAAAEESARLFAYAEALVQLRAALALGHQPIDVHQAIGLTLVRLGRYDEALVSLDQAAALAEGDPQRLATIEHATAGVYDRLGEWGLAQAHLEAARDLLAEGPAQQRARVLAALALVWHRQGRASEAEETASHAGRAALEGGDEAALAQADNVLGILAEGRGERAKARRHFEQVVVRARGLDDLDLLIASLNNLSRALLGGGDDRAAMEAATEALRLAERQGDRHRLAALHSHLADLLHAAGREEEARAALKSSAAAFADIHGSQARPEVWTLAEW